MRPDQTGDVQPGPSSFSSSSMSTSTPKRKISGVDRRRKDGPSLKYFRKDVENKLFICTIELEDDSEDEERRVGVGRKECGQQLRFDENTHSGSRSGNLKRHLMRYHKQVYEVVRASEEKEKKQKQEQRQRGIGQKPLENYFRPVVTSLCIKMTKEQFKSGIVSMVVCESVAFRFFESQGFKAVSGVMAEKLGVSLDRARVRDYVMELGQQERSQLSNDLKGKPVYVKLDCATRIWTNYSTDLVRQE